MMCDLRPSSSVESRRLTLFAICLWVFAAGAEHASARVITFDYTGTVTVALSGHTRLPAGIADGSVVTGSVSFDTANAVEAYAGGNAVPFTFDTGLTETVSIGANSWTRTGGQVVLAYVPPPSFIGCGGGGCGSAEPELGTDILGVDSGVTSAGPNLSVDYFANLPGIFRQGIGAGLDQDLAIYDADGASGTIVEVGESAPFDYYINYNIDLPKSAPLDGPVSPDPAVPEPNSLFLVCTSLVALAAWWSSSRLGAG